MLVQLAVPVRVCAVASAALVAGALLFLLLLLLLLLMVVVLTRLSHVSCVLCFSVLSLVLND